MAEIKKEGKERIKNLASELEASPEEIVREALSLYDWCVEKIKQNAHIRVLKKIPGKEQELTSIKPVLHLLQKLEEKYKK